MITEIQKIIFPTTGVCDVESLFYRKIGLPTSPTVFRGEIPLLNQQKVSFDTYYNCLSLSKYVRYTTFNSSFFLRVRAKGKITLSLLHSTLTTEKKPSTKTLSVHVLESTDEKDFIIPYHTETLDGCLSFLIKGETDGSVFLSASYLAETAIPPQKVRIAVGICTYNREKYVVNNLVSLQKEVFTSKSSPLYGQLEVFISDNAGSLNLTCYDESVIHLFKNKNTGGSGGFARCIIEINRAIKKGGFFTHVLLMDDDVIFHVTALERTYTLLRYQNDNYRDAFIGGGMFKADKPNVQHASGERWRGNRPQNFVHSNNYNKDMTLLTSVLENENFAYVNYQAWWYCAIPIEKCTLENLPLPLFIKSDDIEFSIRNTKKFITLNGINVWHESFESKYSAQNEYYTIRNYLISSSIHRQNVSKRDIIILLKKFIRHYITNYKYLENKFFCSAINDFLKGVDFFINVDMEKFHKSLSSMGYKMESVEKFPFSVTEEQYLADVNYKKQWSKRKKLFAKFTLNGLLLPPKGYSVLGMWGGTYAQTYRKKFLFRYEISSKKGFVLQRSLSKTVTCLFDYFCTVFRVFIKFEKVKKEFFLRKTELYSYALWKKQLGLSD